MTLTSLILKLGLNILCLLRDCLELASDALGRALHNSIIVVRGLCYEVAWPIADKVNNIGVTVSQEI